MRSLLRIFSFLVILGAAPVALVGSMYSGPYGVATPPKWLSAEQVKSVAELAKPGIKWMKDQCYGNNAPLYQRGDACKYSRQGLYFFTQNGLIAIAVAILLLILSYILPSTKRKYKQAKPTTDQAPPSVKAPAAGAGAEAAAKSRDTPRVEGAQGAAAVSAAAAVASAAAAVSATEAERAAAAAANAAAAAHGTVSTMSSSDEESAVIDETELLALEEQLSISTEQHDALSDAVKAGFFDIPVRYRKGQFKDEKFFYNIGKVIAMAQAEMTADVFVVAVTVLRPEFLPFINTLDDKVKNRIGRQIMQYHGMHLKRSEKNISPSQFSAQDRRMGEVDRETICRRFVPHDVKHVPEHERDHIGRVFVLTDQYRIQQNTLSHADDWQDISLRTFVPVMKMSVDAD